MLQHNTTTTSDWKRNQQNAQEQAARDRKATAGMIACLIVLLLIAIMA